MLIGTKEYEEVEGIGEYDYSWSLGALLRDPDGAFFWFYDSGCSCTYFGMDATEEDLVPLKIPSDAVEEARNFYFSEDEICNFSQRIAAHDWR